MLGFKKGFTLIELLTTIFIIGVLATIVIASATSSQRKGRDSKRKADLEALKNAMEAVRNDSPSDLAPGCTVLTACGLTASGSSVIPNIVSGGYIKSVPLDPLGASYLYIPGCAASQCATSYTLVACLENTNDPKKDDVDGGSNDKCGTVGTPDGRVSFSITSNLSN